MENDNGMPQIAAGPKVQQQMKLAHVRLLAVGWLLLSNRAAIQTDREHRHGWMLLIRLYGRDSDVAHIHYIRSQQKRELRGREQTTK